MVNCGWGDLCTKNNVNIDHSSLKASYVLAAGPQQVCIGGRSGGVALDEVCLDKTGGVPAGFTPGVVNRPVETDDGDDDGIGGTDAQGGD